MAPDTVSRFYLLDILRGLAAFAVIVLHYQHFFYVAPDEPITQFQLREMPFYVILSPFYDYGAYAVALFFSLSGFIFFSQYLEPVEKRAVGARTFFVLRFSRLYPLHIATLLIVAALQALSRQIDGHSIIYACNDGYNFVLQLFVQSSWGLSRCFLSFNAPIWSVSIEMFLYIGFFIFAALPFKEPRIRMALTLAAAVFGAICMIQGRRGGVVAAWGAGILCFYAGGFVWLLIRRLLRTPHNLPLVVAIGAALLIASSCCLLIGGGQAQLVLYAGVFPSTVLLLAALQYRWRTAGHGQRLIGDISYATYLLHFPVQLTLLLLIKANLIAIDFKSAIAFFGFFAAVIVLSILCNRHFERPAQDKLRSVLLRREQRVTGSLADRGVAGP
jgi:peptidoglycan/LPS O-acetylase OafA/YrhL